MLLEFLSILGCYTCRARHCALSLALPACLPAAPVPLLPAPVCLPLCACQCAPPLTTTTTTTTNRARHSKLFHYNYQSAGGALQGRSTPNMESFRGGD